MIHRDLKPGNLFITENNRNQTLDFGLAWQVRRSVSRVSAQKADSSGTPEYMSPESFLAGRPDRRQDVYALACLTYEMLAGEPPYDALIARNRPRDIYPEAPEGLPEHLWPILKQALAYDREARPESAEDFVKILKQGRPTRPKESRAEAQKSPTDPYTGMALSLSLG